jgi:aminopeptidase N
MPEISKIPVDGTNHVTTKFQTIESVQSYLIAFIVSDFTAAEDLSGHIPQRVFARKQLIDAGEAKLAIDVSRAILEGFESYLGTNFSLPKMDQAGLSDFAAGAMENWVENVEFHYISC